jgi:branched-chain amino acid transport system ATP-binding protein
MTVLENLNMGAYHPAVWQDRASRLADVVELFPILGERREQLAGTLSGGEQQMLAIGRALMAEPRLLMLDEPSLGLAPRLVGYIFQVIGEIRDQGVTILLVEQNASMALRIADRGYVLETGRVALSGTGEELIDNQHVRQAYLGL